ncbi:hypothetical protein M0804_014594 [Polistes exclamans]|nr:hypothetical protein M0804_014594 [Polistes exclamans]
MKPCRRDTYTTAMFGNLARGSSTVTGSRGCSLEEEPKCTVRCIEDLETDVIPVRTHKRARPITYTSSSKGEVIDLTSMDGIILEGPSVSNLETGRLIDRILENIAEAEVKRKTCGNIKGEISESLQQLRAEAKATNNRLKLLEEECTRLRREIKRKDAKIEKVSKGEAKNAPIKVAANQVGSFAGERLVAARKEDELDRKTMGRVLTKLSQSMIKIQQELKDMKTGQGLYAQVAARPQVAPSPPMTTPLTTVPDGDRFVEVKRRNNTVGPTGGPLPAGADIERVGPSVFPVERAGPASGGKKIKRKKKKK